MSIDRSFKRILLASTALLVALVCLFARAADKMDHRSYKDAKLEECRECHRSSSVVENHGPQFLRLHRLEAEKTSDVCFQCHQVSYCLDCHNGGKLDNGSPVERSLSRRGETMPQTHAADFISIHPIKAADDPQSCYRCHQATFCSDCHTRQINSAVPGAGRSAMTIKPHAPVYSAPGVPDPSWVSFHRTDARRNLQSCQGCHPVKSNCSNPALGCHPSLGGR